MCRTPGSTCLPGVSTAFLCRKIMTHKSRYFDRGKEMISFYVGTTNRARRVYADAGFVGLGNNDVQVEGIENWVETGFDRRKVDLGHWQ